MIINLFLPNYPVIHIKNGDVQLDEKVTNGWKFYKIWDLVLRALSTVVQKLHSFLHY